MREESDKLREKEKSINRPLLREGDRSRLAGIRAAERKREISILDRPRALRIDDEVPAYVYTSASPRTLVFAARVHTEAALIADRIDSSSLSPCSSFTFDVPRFSVSGSQRNAGPSYCFAPSRYECLDF